MNAKKKKRDKDALVFYGMVGLMLLLIFLLSVTVPGDGKLALRMLLSETKFYLWLAGLVIGCASWYYVVVMNGNLPGWIDRNGNENPLVRIAAFALVTISFVIIVWTFAQYKNPANWNPEIRAKAAKFQQAKLE